MQLVAYGAQDIYLTGNPQITFFKVVYRRHTNFSMESIEQTFNGSATSLGSRVTATVSRNGDLIHRMYLELDLDSADNETVNPGHSIINSVELEIGGQRIDKHYGHWMEVWSELTEPNTNGAMGTVGGTNGTKFQNMSAAGGCIGANADHKAFVPLQFWFCRNPGLALPLIALQYHEVKVILELASALTGLDTVPLDGNKLWVDYIYLDTDERRRFAQVSHEYLIEQLQHQSFSSVSSAVLNFNHPVKELVWTGEYTAATGKRGTLNTGNYKLVLNGHDRFAERDLKYFTQQQVYDYHTGTPIKSSNTSAGVGKCSNDEIAVYSFALKPEEHQPSGTCNFSRIDNAKLTGTFSSQSLNVYAVNYNVLRIMSGMGGLAYSN